MQVRLQSSQTRLTAASRLGATLVWQVDDLMLPLPGSELVTVNEHTDGPGAHLVGVLWRMGLAAFSRLGPLSAANWFGGQRLMCCRARRVRGHGLGQPDAYGVCSEQIVAVACVCVCPIALCDVSPRGVCRCRVACRQYRSSGVLGSRMPPPLQPSRASVCMGGFCARERLSVTVTVRIVLGLRLTRALSCERCF